MMMLGLLVAACSSSSDQRSDRESKPTGEPVTPDPAKKPQSGGTLGHGSADCADPDVAPTLACERTEGLTRCCLQGCTSAIEPLSAAAFSVLDLNGNRLPHKGNVVDSCVVITRTGGPQAGPAGAVAIERALLPARNGAAPTIAEPTMEFGTRTWWCPADDADTCRARISGDPGTLRVLALHEHDLLKSEHRQLERCAANLAGKGRKVAVEHVTSPQRQQILGRWLDEPASKKRSTVGLDEAVLHDGLTLIVRWRPALELPDSRGGASGKRFSCETDAIGLVRAAPSRATEEFAWLRAPLYCGPGDSEQSWWLEEIVTRSQRTLAKRGS